MLKHLSRYCVRSRVCYVAGHLVRDSGDVFRMACSRCGKFRVGAVVRCGECPVWMCRKCGQRMEG